MGGGGGGGGGRTTEENTLHDEVGLHPAVLDHIFLHPKISCEKKSFLHPRWVAWWPWLEKAPQ